MSGDLAGALVEAETTAGPVGAWRRGWVLAAMGRFPDALEALNAVADGPIVVTAAARATEASVYRQMGRHQRASEADQAGLAILRGQGAAAFDVRANLHIGRVADGVGLGLAVEELERRLAAAGAAVAEASSPRQELRLDWVAGEVTMVAHRWEEAFGAFERARRTASTRRWRRHQAKSEIFSAAALCAAGQRQEGTELARTGLERAARCGAAALERAAVLVLTDCARARGR